MPLRDHFRPPVSQRSSWEGFHGQWPAAMIQELNKRLPSGYFAEPRVHLGTMVEIDIGTFESDEPRRFDGTIDESDGGAMSVWAPVEPNVAVETTLPEQYEYEVRVYDSERERHLVAAIELVSPANKDRPEHRAVFVAKCAALLQKGVAVSIVDLVTSRRFNLYRELLELIGHVDPTLSDPTPSTYAASCRTLKRGRRSIFEAWSNALVVGQPLPTLPIWLDAELAVPLDLETCYEQTCRDLRIT
jgi:hypothetical protein